MYKPSIYLVDRDLPNGPGDRGSITGQVHTKGQKTGT